MHMSTLLSVDRQAILGTDMVPSDEVPAITAAWSKEGDSGVVCVHMVGSTGLPALSISWVPVAYGIFRPITHFDHQPIDVVPLFIHQLQNGSSPGSKIHILHVAAGPAVRGAAHVDSTIHSERHRPIDCHPHAGSCQVHHCLFDVTPFQ